MKPNQYNSEIVLTALTKQLSPKPRDIVMRRFGHMTRELKYLQDRNDRDLEAAIYKFNLSIEQIEVIFAFNSVYQEIIGPLKASIRKNKIGLGASIPILHGTTVFNNSRSYDINLMAKAFDSMLATLKIEKYLMPLNTCRDVVYRIAHPYQIDENGEASEG